MEFKDIVKWHEEDVDRDKRDAWGIHIFRRILQRESALIELVREMKPYLWHEDNCVPQGEELKCTCGLDALKKKLEETP